MEEFRPSYRITRGDGGRKLDLIINANMLKYVNKVYFGRSQAPSFDPSPFDQNQDAKKKKNNKKSMLIKTWWNEPKMKGKRRLTNYKMYTLEGNLKDSLKKGQRWIKKKYHKLVHGY
ncbi:hypothetical protein REPUB_Repub06bG0008000 [Reevesia pubescens]